jgi:hypothetical protein
MDLMKVLQKAWHMLWSYRAIWLFGAILALVTINMVIPSPWFNREEINQWTTIKLSDKAIIQVPGADMTIDLTSPEGLRITIPDAVSWREFQALVNELNLEESINLWQILIELAVILIVSLLLAMLLRYIAETAVIRMVDVAEESDRHLSVWGGLRAGWSKGAGRLFLLDLIITVLAAVVFVVALGVAAAPVLLAIGRQEGVIISAGVGTLGLLVLATYLWLAASAVLSLVLQPIRRACVLEEQSLLASIRQGVTMTRRHLREIGPLWLTWMGIRLLWVPLGALLLVLLAPILLLTTLAGVAAGGAPAALVAGIAGQYASEITSWIMGGLIGFPIFIVVTISPLLFLSGLVEVYKSTIWTLAYRELRARESPVPSPAAQSLTPAQGAADL